MFYSFIGNCETNDAVVIDVVLFFLLEMSS